MAESDQDNVEEIDENEEEDSEKKGKLSFLSRVKLPSFLSLSKLKSLPKKRLIIFFVLLLFILSAIGAGIYLTKDSEGSDALQEKEEVITEEIEPDEREEQLDLNIPNDGSGGKVLEFDEMIVNISGISATGAKTTRFLKLKVSRVVKDNDNVREIKSRQIYMRDAFQDYLRQVDERELLGSIGLLNLKTNLLQRAKAILGNTAPQEILVLDLIVQ